MHFLVLAGSALSLGFLHGLGADHLMAIAALSVDGRRESAERRRHVMTAAVQFAAGHAVLLGVGATLAVTFGWVVPATVESGAERVGGLLLVLLGVAGLWSILTGRAYGHLHGVAQGPKRWHLHFGRRRSHDRARHDTTTLPAVMGAIFAVSSLRMLMLLTPFGAEAGSLGLPVLLALVALFGAGILLSMSLFGVVLARVLSLGAIERLGRAAAATVALASMLLGLYWMAA
jgi:hypothetical protein